MRRASIFIFCLILFGCASPFSQFYVDKTGGIDITRLPVAASSDEPKLYRGGDPEHDYVRMMEENYRLIGYSAFNAGNVSVNGAISQAKKVHASVILVYSKYTHSVSGSIPLFMPDVQTSTTTVQGSVYGPRGSATIYGSGQTTTYGTTTSYIPYTVHRSDYFAAYWVKMRPPAFGIHFRDLPHDVRQKIGSNKGVEVIAVVKNSPAFHADILRGDVLKRVEGIEVTDVQHYQQIGPSFAGKKVKVLLLRNGVEIVKEIQLNPAP